MSISMPMTVIYCLVQAVESLHNTFVAIQPSLPHFNLVAVFQFWEAATDDSPGEHACF